MSLGERLWGLKRTKHNVLVANLATTRSGRSGVYFFSTSAESDSACTVWCLFSAPVVDCGARAAASETAFFANVGARRRPNRGLQSAFIVRGIRSQRRIL